MYIDYKKTTWERVNISDGNLSNEELIKLIKENEQSNSRLWDILPEKGYSLELEHLDDCDEFLTVKDNDGCNTVELYDDNHECIWGNGDTE